MILERKEERTKSIACDFMGEVHTDCMGIGLVLGFGKVGI